MIHAGTAPLAGGGARPAGGAPPPIGALTDDPLEAIHRRGDVWMGRFLAIHLLIAVALAPVHGTWLAALTVGGGAAAVFFAVARAWPGRFVTRATAGIALQAFVALHIFQMAGLAEMHFFFFTAVTAMIIYKDWRALWPGVFAIIAQHTIFHHFHNQGIHLGGLPFFEPEQVTNTRMTLHYGLAIAQVAIASFWAHVLQARTLRDAHRQADLERANAELTESEQRFRSTFDQAAVGMAHVGLNGRWLRVNQRLCDILGYTEEELRSLTFQQITFPDDVEPDVALVQQVLAGELTTYSIEKRYARKDGTLVWTALTVSLVRRADGTPRYFISVVEDIDARKRAEAERDALHAREAEARREAEAANRAKMQFLSAMSHELRTPLNAITGYVDLIDLGIHGPVTDAQTQALQRVRRSGEHLLGLINDVLTYAKIEAGRMEYAVAEIPLRELIDESVAMIEPHLPTARLRCEVIALDPAPRALGDPERVRQIVINLLGNAIKFTPAGGRIEVSCGYDHERAFLRVRDTGVGIAPAMLAKIFDPFVQVRDGHASDTSRQGIGLGLAISRDLATAMGGDLRAESTPGVGSTFTLLLPPAQLRISVPGVAPAV